METTIKPICYGYGYGNGYGTVSSLGLTGVTNI